MYSRNDNNNSNGYVKASGNVFTCQTITNIGSRASTTTFRTIDISGNTIIAPVYQHTGITTIANYIYNNTITP
jgi:hypothetical protein